MVLCVKRPQMPYFGIFIDQIHETLRCINSRAGGCSSRVAGNNKFFQTGRLRKPSGRLRVTRGWVRQKVWHVAGQQVVEQLPDRPDCFAKGQTFAAPEK